MTGQNRVHGEVEGVVIPVVEGAVEVEIGGVLGGAVAVDIGVAEVLLHNGGGVVKGVYRLPDECGNMIQGSKEKL